MVSSACLTGTSTDVELSSWTEWKLDRLVAPLACNHIHIAFTHTYIFKMQSYILIFHMNYIHFFKICLFCLSATAYTQRPWTASMLANLFTALSLIHSFDAYNCERIAECVCWVSRCEFLSSALFCLFLFNFFPSPLFLLFCFSYFNLVPAPLVNKWSSVYKVKDVPLHWHDWLCYWTLSALTEPLRTDVFSVFIDKKKTNHRCLLNAHICAEALAEM